MRTNLDHSDREARDGSEERRIWDLGIGEEAHVNALEVSYCVDGVYLNRSGVLLESSPSGAKIRVRRIGNREKDYAVDVNGSGHCWLIETEPFNGMIDGEYVARLGSIKELPDRIDVAIGHPSLPECNKERYPKTYELRVRLVKAVLLERYEEAASLRDLINKSLEPLK